MAFANGGEVDGVERSPSRSDPLTVPGFWDGNDGEQGKTTADKPISDSTVAVDGAVPTFEEYKAWVHDNHTPHPFCAVLEPHLTDDNILRSMYEAEYVKWVDKSVLSTINVVFGFVDNVHPFATAVAIEYCVDNGLNSIGLGSTFKQDLALPHAQQAMRRWEQQANVRFVYRSQYDATCMTTSAVDLRIHHNPNIAGGCAAFPYGFNGCPAPSTSKSAALNYVNQYAPGTQAWVQIGLMTHELGHFLGLRHEVNHSQAPVGSDPACVAESPSFRDATAFWDSVSVMGPQNCAGATWTTGLVSFGDGIGIRSGYGAPPVWTAVLL